MRYSVLTYLIGEGFSNVFKNKKQAFTAIGTMFLAMLIFGVFFVIGQNLNHFVEQIEKDQAMQVYIKDEATQEQIDTLKKQIMDIDGVNTVEYVSKADALQIMKDRMGADLLEAVDENVLPASYVIRMTDLTKSDEIQEKIEKLENVDSITSSNKTINTLVKIANGIKGATYVILISLVIFAVFIITNTIKLTVHARRKEISIMKYVGATNGFIRWPFAVEGMIIGLIAGAIAIGVLAIMYSLIVRNQGFIQFLNERLRLSMLNFSSMLNLILIVYTALGIGIGAIGSTISMRKYLKV